jgi:hypothetical protein
MPWHIQEMSKDFDMYLPKWPAMFVRGDSLTKEQAFEIIRRTDLFFDSIFEGFNSASPDLKKKFSVPLAQQGFGKFSKWCECWGYIRSSYLRNDWIDSNYIGGPHGWCHPDGKIQSFYNIGKYPSVEDILSDWQVVAEQFPFLTLTATIFSGEMTESGIEPLFDVVVKDGQATMSKTSFKDVQALLSEKDESKKFAGLFRILRGESPVSGVPTEWIEELSKQFQASISKL